MWKNYFLWTKIKPILVQVCWSIVACHAVLGQDTLRLEKGMERVWISELESVFQLGQGELLLGNLDGKIQFRYVNTRLGEIFSLDVNKPLKPLLFLRNNNQVIVLDNTLAERQEVLDFSQPGLGNVMACAWGIGNTLWIFEAQTRRLKQLSMQLEVLNEGQDLSLFVEDEFNPTRLRIEQEWICVIDPEVGFTLCDQFGVFQRFVSCKPDRVLKVTERYVYFQEGEKLKRYDRRLFRFDELLDLNAGEVVCALGVDKLWIQQDNLLYFRHLKAE